MSYAIYIGKNHSATGHAWIAGYGDEPSSHWLEVVPGEEHPDGAEIVVKGNIYIADTVMRANNDSALVLVAMADGESYTDLNGNETYDVGEPIIDDDGAEDAWQLTGRG